MNNKIYTKTGDSGESSLFNGTRASKSDIVFEVIGTSDELSAHLGLVYDLISNLEIKGQLKNIIYQLFQYNTIVAKGVTVSNNFIDDTNILEGYIDEMEEELTPLTNFIYPFGDPLVSNIHITRTVCRRLERNIVNLLQYQEVHPGLLMYINRLSDYLFMLARFMTYQLNKSEIIMC